MTRLRDFMTTPLGPLAPLGWLLVAIVALAILGLFKPKVLGFQFDPFGLDERKIESLTDERDYARSDASARRLEAEGERVQSERLQDHARVVGETRTITAEADARARSAPDANDLLPADRADRLRDADRRMCELAPDVCAAAAPKPVRGGDQALSSTDPS